jgi:hypothetical protein
MRPIGKLLLATGALGLLVIALFVAPAGAQPLAQASASSCTPATNIEAIVDDSGSMEITDGGRLRVQAMSLLIDTLSKSTLLGAVEFGSALGEQPGADTLFPPQPVGPNATTMRTALDQKVHADNGATDYNAGFAQSDTDNPNANARIFLTDGGHIVGTYNEAHLVHNVPTYVIGFGGVASGEDQARLQKIASDTGGKYFPLEDSAQLQSVMNSIGAALTCQTPPRLFTDQLAKGQSKIHSIAIGAATKSIQITLTWASPLDKFKVSGLRLIGKKGRLLAIAPRPHRPAKLKVTRTSRATFSVLKVSRLRKGRLRFAVKATAIGSGQPKVTLTTQVGQSSRK